jgi:hypothetical protein
MADYNADPLLGHADSAWKEDDAGGFYRFPAPAPDTDAAAPPAPVFDCATTAPSSAPPAWPGWAPPPGFVVWPAPAPPAFPTWGGGPPPPPPPCGGGHHRCAAAPPAGELRLDAQVLLAVLFFLVLVLAGVALARVRGAAGPGAVRLVVVRDGPAAEQ